MGEFIRGLIVWLAIMSLETIHGVLRNAYFVPLVGETASSRIGWPVAALLVLAVSVALFNWMGLQTSRQLWSLGAVWAVLTLAFEVAIGLARGLTSDQVAADFNPLHGGLSLFSLILMFAAPTIAHRLRRAFD